jgi:hypothetical protein
MPKNFRFIAAALGMLVSVPHAAFAAYCQVDTTYFPNTSTIIASQVVVFGGNLCGHTIYGAGCTVNADIDGSWSTNSSPCLTLGKGVTINGNPSGTDPSVITCTSDYCGDGISMSLSSGSGSSTVDDVIINGCFTNGVRGTSSLTSKVEASTIDLAPVSPVTACNASAANIAISTVDTVNTSAAIHARYGIKSAGQNINDSTAHDNSIAGVWVDGSANSNLDNVFSFLNPYSVYRSGTGKADLNSCVLFNATTCKAYDVTTSSCTSNVLTFSGAATFLDNEIY